MITQGSEMPTFSTRLYGQVSTGHMTPKDDAILRDAAKAELASALGGQSGPHPQMVCAYYGGYIVSCWHDPKEEVFFTQLKEMGHSPSYINIIRIGMAQGLHCLQLDCDADCCDWLPLHDWKDK